MSTDAPYRFLLAVDESTHAERAAQYLAAYAAAFANRDVILLHVVAHRAAMDSATDRTASELRSTAAARRALDAAGAAYRVEIKPGEPADVIAETAAGERVHEVVMGMRGMSQLQDMFLGSVAYKVIRHTTVPVTLVSASGESSRLPWRQAGGVHRVLLATDGSANARRAAEHLCELHRSGVPLEVHLLNVVPPIPDGYIRRFVREHVIATYYQDEGAAAIREARDILVAAGLAVSEHVAAGHAAEKIVRAAAEHGCARIMMGTRGLSVLKGMVMGSVAHGVLHSSPLPVTLVK